MAAMILGVFVILALCVLIVIKRIDYREEASVISSAGSGYALAMPASILAAACRRISSVTWE